jgi:hypothetical protein
MRSFATPQKALPKNKIVSVNENGTFEVKYV